MHTSTRSYLTAGIAAFGAGAIALSPVQAPNVGLTTLPQKAMSQLAVDLAAAVTPVPPLVRIAEVVEASVGNFNGLLDDWTAGLNVDGTFPYPPNTGTCILPSCNGNLGYREGGYATGFPLPILLQSLLNVGTYLGELPAIETILVQIATNIGNALGAPFVPGVNETGRFLNLPLPAFLSDYYNQNVNGDKYIDIEFVGSLSQRDVGALLPSVLGDAYAGLEPIINFATSPISGLLVGAIGPIVAPVLATVAGISNSLALLQESNFLGAVTELVNIPANAINAFLNGGQFLDLTPVLSLVGVTLPDSVKSLGLNLGGLFSPGGVAFDSLAAEAAFGDIPLDIPGHPVGPIGALVSLTNYISKSIVVTPPTEAEAPAAASAVAVPAAAAAAAAAPAAEAADDAAESVAKESAPAESAAKESAPAAEAAVDAAADAAAPVQAAAGEDDAAEAPTRVGRSGRSAKAGGDSGSSASTPKRAGRSAASRAG